MTLNVRRSLVRVARQVPSMALLAICATLLEGCDVFSVPSNPAESLMGALNSVTSSSSVGQWRSKPNYLIQYQFIPPGAGDCGGVLNSCSVESADQQIQCSGRGVCRAAYPHRLDNPIYFCKCDEGWADPECRTPRKSQFRAFVLSVCLGMFGFDQYYLGYTLEGLAKLLTLGGFGVWWIVDIVRIGSGRIYAKNFRISDDLPKWAFVTISFIAMALFGFAISVVSIHRHVTTKRRNYDARKLRMGLPDCSYGVNKAV